MTIPAYYLGCIEYLYVHFYKTLHWRQMVLESCDDAISTLSAALDLMRSGPRSDIDIRSILSIAAATMQVLTTRSHA